MLLRMFMKKSLHIRSIREGTCKRRWVTTSFSLRLFFFLELLFVLAPYCVKHSRNFVLFLPYTRFLASY